MILKNIKDFVNTQLKEALKSNVREMRTAPSLAIFQVGDNPASVRYVRNKIKDCKEVGIDAHWYNYEEDISSAELITDIKNLAKNYDGIIVQLPLPSQIDVEDVRAVIPKEKDVDGFVLGSSFNACTPKGIIDYLDFCGFSLTGKNVVIFGRSDIVGKPLARLMTNRNATVTLCHSKSQNIEKIMECADLIVTAVGKAGFLDCSDITVPVIDVGINFVDGRMVGDCVNGGENVTPVPGGVGLLTRCALLENVVIAHEMQKGKN